LPRTRMPRWTCSEFLFCMVLHPRLAREATVQCRSRCAKSFFAAAPESVRWACGVDCGLVSTCYTPQVCRTLVRLHSRHT
jgi:hypothetical protein